MGIGSNYWHGIHVRLRQHPKTISAAIDLNVPDYVMVGILTSLWLAAFDYAEDGNLWRGDNEGSYRFIRILSGYDGNVEELVAILRKNNWLDDWLIHDWPDYIGVFLIKKYKTSNRQRLVDIWALHGRIYGGRGKRRGNKNEQDDNLGLAREDHDIEVIGNHRGSIEEVNRNKVGSEQEGQHNQLTLHNQTTPDQLPEIGKALSPRSPKKKRENSPINPAIAELVQSDNPEQGNGDFSSHYFSGSRVQGNPTLMEMPSGGFTIKDVWDVFNKVLIYFGILTMRQLNERVRRCDTTPAMWVMLFMDKVHAVMREREGGPMYDVHDADPVAMTVAGFRPKNGGPKHICTEAATNFFIEAMHEFAKAQDNLPARWKTGISPLLVVRELEKRKGKQVYPGAEHEKPTICRFRSG